MFRAICKAVCSYELLSVVWWPGGRAKKANWVLALLGRTCWNTKRSKRSCLLETVQFCFETFQTFQTFQKPKRSKILKLFRAQERFFCSRDPLFRARITRNIRWVPHDRSKSRQGLDVFLSPRVLAGLTYPSVAWIEMVENGRESPYRYVNKSAHCMHGKFRDQEHPLDSEKVEHFDGKRLESKFSVISRSLQGT